MYIPIPYYVLMNREKKQVLYPCELTLTGEEQKRGLKNLIFRGAHIAYKRRKALAGFSFLRAVGQKRSDCLLNGTRPDAAGACIFALYSAVFNDTQSFYIRTPYLPRLRV